MNWLQWDRENTWTHYTGTEDEWTAYTGLLHFIIQCRLHNEPKHPVKQLTSF